MICRVQLEENMIRYMFVYVKFSKNKLTVLLIIRDAFNKSCHLNWALKGEFCDILFLDEFSTSSARKPKERRDKALQVLE